MALDLNDIGQLDALVASGILGVAERDLVARQAKATGLAPWRVLLDLNLVTPETLAELQRGGAASATTHPATGERNRPMHRHHLEPEADSPRLLDRLLDRALESRATDIHFDPCPGQQARVRLRVDGQLHDVLHLPAGQAMSLLARIKILANLDILEKRAPQDGHMLHPGRDGRERNLRVATVPTHTGERLVLRLLDPGRVQMGLESLGFTAEQVCALEELLNKPYGIVAVTGPVGAGKSTTLYSCIDRLNQPTRSIMTIEDPIEFQLPGINQSQVDAKWGWTYPQALRAMLRQDPDILMVGEVRDDETAKIAMRAALTGVLVLTSMHASDSASAVEMLYNYGIPGHLLSAGLLGVVAQRLVRKINPASAESFDPDESTRRALGLEPGEMPGLTLRRGRGSDADFGTGYLGRTGVFEVLPIDEELRDMIFHARAKDELRAASIQKGMLPLARHAILKVLEGITTVEEVYRVALL